LIGEKENGLLSATERYCSGSASIPMGCRGDIIGIRIGKAIGRPSAPVGYSGERGVVVRALAPRSQSQDLVSRTAHDLAVTLGAGPSVQAYFLDTWPHRVPSTSSMEIFVWAEWPSPLG